MSVKIKGHERILELHSLLSKLMDSLCFEMAVNRVDDNCLSLLEYTDCYVGSFNGNERATSIINSS